MKNKKRGVIPNNRLIFVLGLLCVFSTGFSKTLDAYVQTKKITLSLTNEPIGEILQQIEKNSEFLFLYSEKVLDISQKKTIHIENQTIEGVLDQLFTGMSIGYEINNRQISLKQTSKTVKQTPLSQKRKQMIVTGIVKDAFGEAVIGATVLFKGIGLGVATDVQGVFSLKIPEMEKITLIISYIGMKTQEAVFDARKPINIVLEEDTEIMDEVVVTGIFDRRAESYTGAVTVITEKELKSFGSRSVLTTLRNIDPSFNMIESNDWGSDPNRLPEIQIRGAASLPGIDQLQDDAQNDLNTPLIILDGFEISLQRMMDLDDNEISSIALLKDATATAIYGSRGANGVVVITTKAPEAGKLKFSYTGSVNIEVPDLTDYDVLNAADKLELERVSGYYDAVLPSDDLFLARKYSEILNDVVKGVDTYWLSKPLRTGIGQRHNLKIEGGDISFRYAATLQFNNVVAVMKESGRNNFNGGINLSYQHEKLIFRNNLSIGLNTAEESPYGSFSDYVKLNPYWTSHDDNGNIRKLLDDDTKYWGNNSDLPTNPMYNSTLNVKDVSSYTDITNNFSIEWKPIQGATIIGRVGVTHKQGSSDNFKPADHTEFSDYGDDEILRKGSYAYGTNSENRYNVSITGNYSKVIAKKHMFYGGVNFDLSENGYYSYAVDVEGFAHESLDFLAAAMQYKKDGKPTGSESTARRVGFVANMSYSYDDLYFVDGSFRTDGSSQFGKNQQFAPFWSAGIGWNLHKEDFLKGNSVINRLKLRASVGTTGSTQFANYEAVARYKYHLDNRYYQWMGASPMGLANPDLTWQKTLKKNIGIELNLLSNRLNIRGDIYEDMTHDLVSSLELAPSNGFDSYSENIGKVQNKGFELRATCFIIRNTKEELIWSVTGGIVHNKNKIVELSEAMKKANEEFMLDNDEDNPEHQSSPNKIWLEGDSQDAIYVVSSLGIDPSTGKELFVKKDGTVTYTWNAADRVNVGVSQPKFRGNLNSMLRYKDLTLNLSFGYEWGGQKYNETLVSRVENADKKYNVDSRVYHDRWIKPGDRTFFKGVNERDKTKNTSRFVQDENVFRCQNINLTYDLRDKKWLKQNLGMQVLTFKVDMGELFRFSTVKQDRGLNFPFARQFSASVTAIF